MTGSQTDLFHIEEEFEEENQPAPTTILVGAVSATLKKIVFSENDKV